MENTASLMSATDSRQSLAKESIAGDTGSASLENARVQPQIGLIGAPLTCS